MAKYIIYFDASGSPDQTQVLSLAGFAAKTSQWTFFEKDWIAVLDEFGASSLHMKDFAHSTKEYSGWKGDEAKRRRFLIRLIAVIKSRVRHSFVNSIYLPDYYEMDKKFCVSEDLKPIGMAGGACIRRVRAWAEKWKIPQDEISYVFEDGDKDKSNLIEVAGKYFDITPIFLSKTASVAFQAADLLAYEHFQANKKVIPNPGVFALEELRFPLQALSLIPNGENSEDWGVQDLEQMEENFKNGGFPSRITSDAYDS